MIVDFDDQGSDHVISDMCRSADARGWLDKLHYANLNFKVTLFAIPGEMTSEQLRWFEANKGWCELAFHGFYHTSNYECEKMTYEEFEEAMSEFDGFVGEGLFTKGFKAPGWQISDGVYNWLTDNGWWVADQAYNNHRRPDGIPAYVNQNGQFSSVIGGVWLDHEAWHGHTWNCVGNGIEETFEHVKQLVQEAESFQFVSEVFK